MADVIKKERTFLRYAVIPSILIIAVGTLLLLFNRHLFLVYCEYKIKSSDEIPHTAVARNINIDNQLDRNILVKWLNSNNEKLLEAALFSIKSNGKSGWGALERELCTILDNNYSHKIGRILDVAFDIGLFNVNPGDKREFSRQSVIEYIGLNRTYHIQRNICLWYALNRAVTPAIAYKIGEYPKKEIIETLVNLMDRRELWDKPLPIVKANFDSL